MKIFGSSTKKDAPTGEQIRKDAPAVLPVSVWAHDPEAKHIARGE